MSISNFRYLEPLVGKFLQNDFLRMESERKECIDALTEQDKTSLRAAYEEIMKREDALPISKYIAENCCESALNLFALCLLMTDLARQDEGLFSGLPPLLVWTEGPTDWGTLPNEWRYIIKPADRYGILQFEEEIAGFASQASEEELELLRDLARQLNDQMPAINSWIDKHGITSSQAARRVYFLTVFLAALDLWP